MYGIVGVDEGKATHENNWAQKSDVERLAWVFTLQLAFGQTFLMSIIRGLLTQLNIIWKRARQVTLEADFCSFYTSNVS